MEQIPIYISPSPSLIIQRERRRGRKLLIKFAIAELILLCSLFGLYLLCVTNTNAKESKVEIAKREEVQVQLISAVAAATEKEESQTIEYEVPEEENGVFTWMDYRCITNKKSAQWILQQEAWTDELGFRRFGRRYMVAMGTYYANQCGKEFQIILENGHRMEVIVADIKNDNHTDPMHQHRNGNVIEFIVDSDLIPNECKTMGDMSFASLDLMASIEKIEEIRE